MLQRCEDASICLLALDNAPGWVSRDNIRSRWMGLCDHHVSARGGFVAAFFMTWLPSYLCQWSNSLDKSSQV